MFEDHAYCDRINGRWELYVYCEEGRVLVKASQNLRDIEGYCNQHGYTLVMLEESPLPGPGNPLWRELRALPKDQRDKLAAKLNDLLH